MSYHGSTVCVFKICLFYLKESLRGRDRKRNLHALVRSPGSYNSWSWVDSNQELVRLSHVGAVAQGTGPVSSVLAEFWGSWSESGAARILASTYVGSWHCQHMISLLYHHPSPGCLF